MKSKRQDAILQIIEKKDTYNQESLLAELENLGYKTTQATISRDIKILGIVKSSTGKYIRGISLSDTDKFKTVFRQAVISVDYALNIVSIKCHSGMANAACAALDMMEKEIEVVGTIAGDDTIFILFRTQENAAEYADIVKRKLN
ncbi:MAG: hypothetical protein RSE93_00885 [Oscillospiraceae bacterium]